MLGTFFAPGVDLEVVRSPYLRNWAENIAGDAILTTTRVDGQNHQQVSPKITKKEEIVSVFICYRS